MPNPTLELVSANEDPLANLEPSVRLLLAGIDEPWTSLRPTDQPWDSWISSQWALVNKAIHQAHQATQEQRMEDIAEASRDLATILTNTDNFKIQAHESALEIVTSLDGARHQRFMDRYSNALQEGHFAGLPPVALAIKASLYNHSLMSAKLAWLYFDWRGSAPESATDGINEFGARENVLQLLCQTPELSNDAFNPFRVLQHG